jgi:hypothetical protein
VILLALFGLGITSETHAKTNWSGLDTPYTTTQEAYHTSRNTDEIVGQNRSPFPFRIVHRSVTPEEREQYKTRLAAAASPEELA